MLDFIIKNNDIIQEIYKDFKCKLNLCDIENFYLKSCKKSLNIGLEYERLSLDKSTGKAASYSKIRNIIEEYCKVTDWEEIFDKTTLIGAIAPDKSTISLEPGCQIEISLRPYENISDIDLRLNCIISKLDNIAKNYDITFLPYGINPTQAPEEIELLNKQRYKIMNNYLPNCSKAELCTTMMRKTAGMQINVDYSNKKDAYLKLKFFNLISPFISGLMANSPYDNNSLSDLKSNRVNVWLFTGENRCNLFYNDIFCHKFFKYENVFKNYIDNILDVPMVFIERNSECIPINGLITFREFMKSGFMDYHATIDDYILHQSLCFPDIRLKQYIEIRNHDSNKPEYALMLCAFYKGLCKENIEKLLSKFNFLKLDNIEKYYRSTCKYGLDFKINDKLSGWDIINMLFNISKKNLNAKDRCYLEPLINMLKFKKTTADYIIDCNISNTSDLINFLSD